MEQSDQGAGEDLVKLEGVYFGYAERDIYEGVDLELRRGAITVVMGPSGCGKSTLLSLIGGRLRARRGRVLFDNNNVGALGRKALFQLRRDMGMMFQSSALLTDLDVFENVAFPIREHTDLDEDLLRPLVLMKLEMVGLRGAAQLMPASLSGGMARRVALARATSLDPKLIMYDEPFTGLDPISKGVIVKLIRDLNDALGMTSVVVTHDIADGLSIADYAYLLGDGRVLAHGTPDQLQQSDSEDVQQFMQGLPDGPVAFHYPAVPLEDDLFNGAGS
jgi:phospholipid/cholesterol/gamma-HCH transport system ATP-binding protein